MAIAKLFALNANAIMWRYWWLMLMNPWNEAKANNYLIIFRMRYYPGTNFDFIGWFCRTEPVSLCKLVSMWDGGREGTGGGGAGGGQYGWVWYKLRTLHNNLGRQGWGDYLMFFDIIFILLTSQHGTPLNTYPPVRQHTLQGSLTAWVKVPPGLA